MTFDQPITSNCNSDPTLQSNISLTTTTTTSPMIATKKILVCGGSFGGKTFLNSFTKKLDALHKAITSTTTTIRPYEYKFDITLVDPRAGFINILAIPRSILNPEFAKTTYATDLELPFNGKVNNPLYDLHYIQGKVIDFESPYEAIIEPNSNSNSTTIKATFDYCIFATGRSRPWPFDPKAYDYDMYLKEMDESYQRISKADKITVVGGGAVGIETAAELTHAFPQKRITLLHPYDKLPPEDLTVEFKDMIIEKLKLSQVDLRLNSRLTEESPGGYHCKNTDTGEIEFVEADLILWCSNKQNNLQSLKGNKFFNKCIDYKTDEICVNEFFKLIPLGQEMTGGEDALYDHFYAIGDVTKLPVIKAAGGAGAAANIVCSNLLNEFIGSYVKENNLQSQIELDPPLKKFESWGKSMWLLVGPNYACQQNPDGTTDLNSDYAIRLYKDFTNGFVSTYYKVKFPNVNKWDV